MEKRAEELKMENERLNAELVKITVATAQLEREKSEVHAMENKRRAEELNELKMINQELKVNCTRDYKFFLPLPFGKTKNKRIFYTFSKLSKIEIKITLLISSEHDRFE